jgi:hypothetical protein
VSSPIWGSCPDVSIFQDSYRFVAGRVVPDETTALSTVKSCGQLYEQDTIVQSVQRPGYELQTGSRPASYKMDIGGLPPVGAEVKNGGV